MKTKKPYLQLLFFALTYLPTIGIVLYWFLFKEPEAGINRVEIYSAMLFIFSGFIGSIAHCARNQKENQGGWLIGLILMWNIVYPIYFYQYWKRLKEA